MTDFKKSDRLFLDVCVCYVHHRAECWKKHYVKLKHNLIVT